MKSLNTVINEISKVSEQIDDEQVKKIVLSILNKDKIFVAGLGRSGFMMKSFAMRLMHIGLNSYVVGETTTPGIGSKDMLIIGSGSGKTPSLVSMLNKANEIGAYTSVITTNTSSVMAQNAGAYVEIKAQSKGDDNNDVTIQPMGSLFEQTLLILLDGIILELMHSMSKDGTNMYLRHANLE